MTWEISMTVEGWDQVRHNLHCHKEKQELIRALSDISFDQNYDRTGDIEEASEISNRSKQNLATLPHDTLAENCLEYIEKYNSCSNGGHEVYINSQGDNTVPVSLQCTEKDCFETWRDS